MRNLRLSTKMVKIHGIWDHLLNQPMKYNGRECFIEDYIEQAHQIRIFDEKEQLIWKIESKLHLFIQKLNCFIKRWNEIKD